MKKITLIPLIAAALIAIGVSSASAKPYSGSQHQTNVSGSNWSITWSWGDTGHHGGYGCPPRQYRVDYYAQGQREGYRAAIRDQRYCVPFHVGKRNSLQEAHQELRWSNLSQRERNEYLRGFRQGYHSAWR